MIFAFPQERVPVNFHYGNANSREHGNERKSTYNKKMESVNSLEIKAKNILAAAGLPPRQANFKCVAIAYDCGTYIVAANGIDPDISSLPTASIINLRNVGNLNSNGERMHAEMAIVRELCRNIKDNELEGSMSRIKIGVSKKICWKCVKVLEFLNIQYNKEINNRFVDPGNWDPPVSFFNDMVDADCRPDDDPTFIP